LRTTNKSSSSSSSSPSAPQYDYSIDNYVAYNKPLSITHWLQTTQVKEDVIIVADPDCAYINKMDYPVEEVVSSF
jgi:hypothetical protein